MRLGIGGQQRAKAPDEMPLIDIVLLKLQFAALDALAVEDIDRPAVPAEIMRLLHVEYLDAGDAHKLRKLLSQTGFRGGQRRDLPACSGVVGEEELERDGRRRKRHVADDVAAGSGETPAQRDRCLQFPELAAERVIGRKSLMTNADEAKTG